MKLSREYITKVKRYIEFDSKTAWNGLFVLEDGTLFATNSVSLILFNVNGDGDYIRPEDFTGIEVEDGNKIKNNIWKHIVDPFMKEDYFYYNTDEEIISLAALKNDSDNVRDSIKETGEIISSNTKLYDSFVAKEYKSSLKYGNMYIVPELMYDVGKIITKKDMTVRYPMNPTMPAVLIGENKYGRHVGFVLGCVR